MKAKPQPEYAESSLILMAMTHIQDGNTTLARARLEQVLREYPNGRFRRDAEELLKRLKEVQGTGVPAIPGLK